MSKGRIHDRRYPLQAYPSAREIGLALKGHRVPGGGWLCCCPAHQDNCPSLSVVDGHCGRPVVHCFAGCDWRDVLNALANQGLWPHFKRHRQRL
jgi:hypothetical protein